MKLTTSFLFLLVSAFTSSASLSCFSGQQAILDARFPVPGNNKPFKLTFCDDPKNYSLKIKEANLTLSEKGLTFATSLDFTETVGLDAVVKQTFKNSSGTTVKENESKFCLVLLLAGPTTLCPVKGPRTIPPTTVPLLLPGVLPKGDITARIDVVSNQKTLTCVEAEFNNK